MRRGRERGRDAMRRGREKRRAAMRSDWEKGTENVRGKVGRQCLVGKVRGNEK